MSDLENPDVSDGEWLFRFVLALAWVAVAGVGLVVAGAAFVDFGRWAVDGSTTYAHPFPLFVLGLVLVGVGAVCFMAQHDYYNR